MRKIIALIFFISIFMLFKQINNRRSENQKLEKFSEVKLPKGIKVDVDFLDKESKKTVSKSIDKENYKTKTIPVKNEALSIMKSESKFRKRGVRRVRFEMKEGWAVHQGDVLLGKPTQSNVPEKGESTPRKTKLWPSPVIAYGIHKDLENKSLVEEVINYFNSNTSVKFVPFSGESDALVFHPAEELCASYLGRVSGHQPILLSPKCGFKQIVHEVMHALGFVHEQSRVDRDEYVEILWDNIKEEYWSQYDLVPDELIHPYKGSVFDFDYYSVMLYSTDSFSIGDGKPTMRSLTNTNIQPTQNGLSDIDLQRIYYLYQF